MLYTVTDMEQEHGPGRGIRREPWTAARVARLRAALGLTQAGLADELGVRQQTVSEWETGRYAPRGASARLLSLYEERAPYDAGAPAPPEPGP